MILGFFFLGLNRSSVERDSVKKPVPTNFSVTVYNAIPGPVTKVQFLQKTWIVNKDSFKLLSFNRHPLSTSKRSDLKISNLNKERLIFLKKPPAIFLYHLFPAETDEPQC
jgi:hypothetical protein